MSGQGRVYAYKVEEVGDIKSTHQYKITVRFDIAFDYGGYNYNSPSWWIATSEHAQQWGNTNISVPSGNGSWVWQWMGDKTFTVTMPTSGASKTINLSASCSTGISPATINANGSYTFSAVTWQWTVSYNANGGSGAPSSQTKTYGSTLTLSSTKPTRTGYTFQGWATSASATSATYSAGGSYTSNAAVTLYAVWKINTYTVSYNANGGSGAPSSQTKTYGKNLTLSSTKPTRTNYDFLGWATSASSTTVAYSAGGTYTNNAAVTLYAVWKLAYWNPRITNLKIERTDSSGDTELYGEYAKVTFNWSICTTAGTNACKSCTIAYGSNSTSVTLSGSSASVIIGTIPTDSTTVAKVTLTDTLGGSSSASVTLQSVAYIIDIKSGGTGVAFGKAAEADKSVQSAWNFEIDNNVASTDTYFIAKRTDTETRVGFGIGTGGVNHGIWSDPNGKWLIYGDGSDVFLSGGALKMTDRETAAKSINFIGSNPISATSNDTRANWVNQGLGVAYYNTASCLNGQPAQWGYLLNLTTGSGSEIGQIFFPYTTGNIYFRGGNNSTTSMPSSWHRALSTASVVSLYNNTSGTSSTITLSETAANFTYLEIYYGKLDSTSGGYSSVKVHNPNGKRVVFSQSNSPSPYMQLVWSKVLISGTSLTWEVSGGYLNWYVKNNTYSSGWDEGKQLIYKVVGYKF
jgi:uncharacterized repeat protein (TIGR02543 family)